MRPVVLSIAGSDSSAGAGIQADLKAVEANGGYAATAITAITAQNTHGVRRSQRLDTDLIGAQIDAVFDDLPVAAVKTGMLADAEVITVVARALRERRPAHVVCDPVMLSKTGFALLDASAVAALREELLPLASLVTPNVAEAEALSGRTIRDEDDAREAGAALLGAGSGPVLVTGGHLSGRPACDVLVTADGHTLFEGEAVDSPHTHGTGCTYSAAIATHLARGRDLARAITIAKRFVTEAIRHGLGVGGGTGPTDPFFFLHDPGAALDGPFGSEP